MADFLHNNKIVLAAAAAASGTTAVASSVIDTHGFDGVVFIANVATANAGNYISVGQAAKADASDIADLEGTKLVASADGKDVVVEVRRPAERYLKATITRGAATATGPMYAILYGPLRAAVTHGSTVESELHLTPDEGTA